MVINAQELFSSAQALPALGEALSQIVENPSMGNLPGTERPFLHIRAAGVAPRSEGVSMLEVALLHSDDCQHFDWAYTPISGMEIWRSTPWAFTPLQLPDGLKRFLVLSYRVTGDRLTGGALKAFLSTSGAQSSANALPSMEAQPAQHERRQNVTAQHVYYPSGFTFPPGYNQPGKYQGER